MTYDRTNTGLLSRNDRKEKDSHPDFKGQINVAGVEYWLSGWVKERKDGTGKFFSLSVSPKNASGAPARTSALTSKPAPSSGFDDMPDSDIPFISSAFACDTATSKARRMARYDY
jgi:hypothetical protein